jgi:hypothetical protein
MPRTPSLTPQLGNCGFDQRRRQSVIYAFLHTDPQPFALAEQLNSNLMYLLRAACFLSQTLILISPAGSVVWPLRDILRWSSSLHCCCRVLRVCLPLLTSTSCDEGFNQGSYYVKSFPACIDHIHTLPALAFLEMPPFECILLPILRLTGRIEFSHTQHHYISLAQCQRQSNTRNSCHSPGIAAVQVAASFHT